MAGHSHWSTIKRKKAVVDARRGKAWGKLSKNITVAARMGGGNPEMNPRLRLAIDKAKAENMTRDTIDKAIKKGTGELEGEDLVELVYEGYGPGGVAVLCQATTDNRHRTAPEIKKIFERRGGNLGATNCVAWMFEQKGVIIVGASAADEDTLMELVLEAGGDDVRLDDDVYELRCEVSVLTAVENALKARNIAAQSVDISMLPLNTIEVDSENAAKVLALLEDLDNHDDVQNVYSNSVIPDEVIAEMEKGG